MAGYAAAVFVARVRVAMVFITGAEIVSALIIRVGIVVALDAGAEGAAILIVGVAAAAVLGWGGLMGFEQLRCVSGIS